MMQTLLCSLIIIAAALYLACRWMPHQLKQRLLQLFGISKETTPSPNNACGSCSSCGSCGGNLNKPTQLAKK